MRKAYEEAKGFHNSISQVKIRYLDWDQQVCIANTEGLICGG
jgi:TldD protein